MNLRRILILGCFAAALTTLSAQEKQQEQLSLSLEQAKEYAISFNRNLKMSDLSVQKAYKAKWQSIASMLPHANATLNYNNYLGYEMDFSGMVIPMNPSGDLTIQATIAITGMQVVGVQMSKMAIEMSETNKNLTELDVKGNVVTGYLSVLIAEESKRLLQDTRNNVQKLFETTSNLYKVGMLEQTDVDQLDVQLGTLDNNIRSVERNIELAYNALRLILGSDSAQIVLTETLDNLIARDNAYQILATPFDLKSNYNVQLLNQNIELSKKQLNLKKWEYGPTLSAFYQYYGRTTFGESEGLSMTPPHAIGASLNIPIFSSGERLSKVQQAKFDVKTAQVTKDEAVEGLLVQEKQLRFNLKSALETYEVQKKNVDVYERIFKNMSQKYELGVASSTDLTTVSNNLISAQSSYISSLMDLLTAQVNLQKLLNNL